MLVVIPARGDSKGVPGKNIKLLGGKPLIHYTIEAARKVVPDRQIIVSTDSPEIKRVAQNTGMTVPFLRPSALAGDKSSMNEVVEHALKYYEKENPTPKKIMLLQPTSPFRDENHIREALESFDDSLDLLISVKEAESSPYFELREENKEGFLKQLFSTTFDRRQELPAVWALNGAIYIVNTHSFKENPLHSLRRVRKYVMDKISSTDIDSPLDWKLAEIFVIQLEELKSIAIKEQNL